LTSAQIKRGLKDRYSEVRAAYAASPAYTPSPEQIERALTDDWLIVRQAIRQRTDIVLTDAQLERASEDERYGFDEPTKYEEYDEDYILESPQCPYCGHRLFGDFDDFCDHVAFTFLESYGPSAESAATPDMIDWLGDNESRRHFDRMCSTFKLKRRHFTEEGMACGPVTMSGTIAYSLP
jgi:hypothetical protein